MLTRQSLQDQFHFHQNLQEFNKMNYQIAQFQKVKKAPIVSVHINRTEQSKRLNVPT